MIQRFQGETSQIHDFLMTFSAPMYNFQTAGPDWWKLQIQDFSGPMKTMN